MHDQGFGIRHNSFTSWFATRLTGTGIKNFIPGRGCIGANPPKDLEDFPLLLYPKRAYQKLNNGSSMHFELPSGDSFGGFDCGLTINQEKIYVCMSDRELLMGESLLRGIHRGAEIFVAFSCLK